MDRKTGREWEGGPTLVTAPDGLNAVDSEDRRLHPEEEVPALVELSGASPGRRHLLQSDECIIGRGVEAHVRLEANNISRQHARLLKQPDGAYLIEDMGSRNGTLVNDAPIEPKPLRPGDRIRLGEETVLLFTYHNPVEEKFIEAQKLESIGRLAGGIAHDFNNIMASLLTDIHYLQSQLPEGLDPQEAAECLKTMESAARRAVRLTDRLLGFARAGKYANRPLDMSELLEEVTSFISSSDSAGIEVALQVEGTLRVEGDRHQLRQVLLNLLLNARDAMPHGGRLLVTATTEELSRERALSMAPLRAGPHVVIEIHDTGVGMSEETLRRAFEPYFTTKSVGRGSGLGLAAVYGIIKNHGGYVGATSTPGEGSTFRVYLASARRRRKSEETTSPSLPNVSRVVLVADDDEVVRGATSQALVRMGFATLTAADGRQAVELFTEHGDTICLVVLDMFMPKVSGKETFKLLRQLSPEVKVLLTSGYLEEERVEDLTGQEGVIFLQKPYRPAGLRRAVQALLGASLPSPPQGDAAGPQPIGVLKKE